MDRYRKKTVHSLLILLLIFAVVGIFGLYSYSKGILLFDIGISEGIQNMVIVILSFIAIIKIIVELVKIESHSDFKYRVKLNIKD